MEGEKLRPMRCCQAQEKTSRQALASARMKEENTEVQSRDVPDDKRTIQSGTRVSRATSSPNRFRWLQADGYLHRETGHRLHHVSGEMWRACGGDRRRRGVVMCSGLSAQRARHSLTLGGKCARREALMDTQRRDLFMHNGHACDQDADWRCAI